MKGLDLLGHVLFPGQCIFCGTPLNDEDDPLICGRCVPVPEEIERPCSVCGKELLGEIGMCLACRSRDRQFRSHRSLFEYSGVASRMIRAFKFEHRRPLAQVFARVLTGTLKGLHPGVPLVPVPAGKRRKERGWDPVAEVARQLDRCFGHEVLWVLERRAGESAKGLSREARWAETRSQYRMSSRGPMRHRLLVPNAVVLLDDIYTTGATLSSCAEILMTWGVRDVYGVTWARD